MENTIKATETLIEERMPVWIALSKIFLNAGLEQPSPILDSIVRVCKKSKYSLKLIEKIYAYEVMPTLMATVSSWEGEQNWAGFDPDWLRERILKYRHGQLVTEKSQPNVWEKLKSRYYTYSSRRDWQKVKQLLTGFGAQPISQ